MWQKLISIVALIRDFNTDNMGETLLGASAQRGYVSSRHYDDGRAVLTFSFSPRGQEAS